MIERRVDEVADRAKHLALSSTNIVALSTFAGLFCTMAIAVGLFALYRTETDWFWWASRSLRIMRNFRAG